MGQNDSVIIRNCFVGQRAGHIYHEVSTDGLCDESKYCTEHVSAASDKSTQYVSAKCFADRSYFGDLSADIFPALYGNGITKQKHRNK